MGEAAGPEDGAGTLGLAMVISAQTSRRRQNGQDCFLVETFVQSEQQGEAVRMISTLSLRDGITVSTDATDF